MSRFLPLQEAVCHSLVMAVALETLKREERRKERQREGEGEMYEAERTDIIHWYE